MARDGEMHTGMCLDIDGTLYRRGSVFVETVASLAVQSGLFDPSARAHFRRAVGTVGEFYGSSFTRWRWEQTLRGLSGLRRWAGPGSAARALDRLREVRERLDGALSTADSRVDPATRKAFQRRLLTQYGRGIAGHDRTALSQALRAVLHRARPIDRGTAVALSRLADSGANIVLVTDMPAHVAAAFAETTIDAPVDSVRGTAFETDDSGVFTGDYETIDKGAVVDAIVDERAWDQTLAAGDTDRDAAMAPHVDTFLAVAGHGGAWRAAKTLPGDPTVRYIAPEVQLGDSLVAHCPPE